MIIYDIETFPNCFLLCAVDINTHDTWEFEISSFKNDLTVMKDTILAWQESGRSMCGFNNVGFDYPVLHFIWKGGISDPKMIYERAMSVINTDDKFKFFIRPSDYAVPQVDLFKIHHFDNKARMTSLKAIEFNMRMDNISDLPFPVGTVLSREQIATLTKYCWNDVRATRLFYLETLNQIEFRRKLSKQYKQDFTNYNDVKIGKRIFEIELEKVGVSCYDYDPDNGRIPRQTKRTVINLADCVPDGIAFVNPEFEVIRQHYLATTITQTKGAFKDLVATIHGLDYVFGTGGIHASVSNRKFVASDEWMIYDVDVTSLYPSLAIENGLYPDHLGDKFVDVYRELRERRLQHRKGTTENDMLKLALNGVYGASNDRFSVFYDPLFTMKVTIAGQLFLAQLIDLLTCVDDLEIVQANTDGITMYIHRDSKHIVDLLCDMWETTTRLRLEKVEYRAMWIADVNSYLAQKIDGEIKRKGRYDYNVGWHQNASALVVPKVAEKVLIDGVDVRQTVEGWADPYDFYLRAKVPRSSRLMLRYPGFEVQLENTQRYYISHGGGGLVKIMPPLPKKPDQWREIGINAGWTVCPFNNINDPTLPVNHDWYVKEVEKLTGIFK